MSQGREIDFTALIDRSIKDFRPVKRLWPVWLRLAVWILLEAGILGLGAGLAGLDGFRQAQASARLAGIAAPVVAGIIAGYAALRSAIPGREAASTYFLLAAAILAVASIVGVERVVVISPVAQLADLARICACAVLPWIAMLWAIRRGAPMYPVKTGALAGLASFCFALAEYQSLKPAAFQAPILLAALACGAVMALSAAVGAAWLDPIRQWRQACSVAQVRRPDWARLETRAAFPLACGLSVAALLLVLWNIRQSTIRIPDFDLAIHQYQQSLAGFHPNVPSGTVQAVLTAYVEHGMPAYMWDFGPEGFKLAGGRLEYLPGGVPVTYTWFVGPKGGVMCMFRQIDGFKPPSIRHEERDHLLFYSYRGFSICLINVGGYGDFISVITAPMPMTEFMHIVLAAVG